MKTLAGASLEGVAFLASAVLAWRNFKPTHCPTFRSFFQSTAAQHPRTPTPARP